MPGSVLLTFTDILFAHEQEHEQEHTFKVRTVICMYICTSSTSQKHISTGTDQALTGLHQFSEQLTTDNSMAVLCCKLNAMKCVSCLLYSTRTFLSMDLFITVGGLLFP